MGQNKSSTVPPPEPQLPPAISIPPVPSQTYLHHTALSPRPKLILIGDSITELGSSHAQGWGTSLAIRYNRRMDVLNRGMNGYNSRWGLAALPLILDEILGPPYPEAGGECLEEEAQPASSAERQELMRHPQFAFLIGYGANDSCIPDGFHSRHHVPLDEYKSNLKAMINLIQTWNTHDTGGNNTIAVALMTPPPCNTDVQKQSRNNENVTRLYAEACIQVAGKLRIPVVDLWSGMQRPISNRTPNSNETMHSSFEKISQQWKIDYLSDGLHLTPMGNYRLYELVVEVLDRSMDGEVGSLGMGLAPTKLPRSFPDHSTIDDLDPMKSFS